MQAPKKPFKHSCELEQNVLHISKHSPYDSKLRKAWNNFRHYGTVSENVDSCRFFPSNASMQREKRRHLETPEYAYVIHPFSDFNLKKELVFTFVWIVVFLISEYVGSFIGVAFYKTATPTMFVLLVLNMLLFMDIVVKFYTGVPIEKVRKIILEPRKIARSYVMGYFVLDFISVISFFLFCMFFLPLKARLFIYQFHKFNLARIYSIIKNIDRVMRSFNMFDSSKIIVALVLSCLFIVHEWTCLFGLINLAREIFEVSDTDSWIHQNYQDRVRRHDKVENDPHLELLNNDYLSFAGSVNLYFLHFLTIINFFFSCGYNKFHIHDYMDRLVFALVIFSGLVFYLFAVAIILQVFGMINISEAKFEELLFEAENYMLKKGFPNEMKSRIFQYFEYKYNKRFFSEQKILDTLSEHLRMEILLYSCRNLITQVKMFKGLSKSAVGCILALLEQEIYLRDDEILKSDNNSGSIYFILYGTCGIRLANGKELTHLEDGSHFCNGHLYSPNATLDFGYSVMALEVAEVYELQQEDVKYCIKVYPELISKLDRMVNKRAQRFLNLFMVSERDEITTEILEQLRRGQILIRGLKRIDFDA